MLKLDPNKNFSLAGKISTNKYYYLIDHSSKLDKILNNKPRKKIVPEDFLHKEDSSDSSSKDDNTNIFADDYKNKHEKLKNIIPCPLHEENENVDVNIRYKHHILHHNINVQKEKSNLNKTQNKIFCIYPIPNKEYTYKKLVYSNSFNKMLGRDDKNINNNSNKNKILNDQIKLLSEKKIIKKKHKKLIKGVSIPKQIPRGDLPNHYDVRIRTAKIKKRQVLSKLFSAKPNKFRTTFNNFINKNNILNIKNKSRYPRNFSSTINKKVLKNNIINNISNDTPIKKNYTISFSKMLSRKYIDKVRSPKNETFRQCLNPDYSYIDPKNCGDIKYKNLKKSLTPSFNGLKGELIYNVKMNFNNHLKSPQYVNFEKMLGRDSDITDEFPVFMNKLYNRHSINSMSEKSLKMNNYINGRLMKQVSTFNDRKSFNIRIKSGNISNNSKNNENNLDESAKKVNKLDIYNKNLELIFKKMIIDNICGNDNNCNKLIDIKKNAELTSKINRIYKNIVKDYYKLNFDYLEKDENFFKADAVDGITFKKINNKKL